MSDWNTRVVEEFRANGGQVSGPLAGANMLLLHTTGAKSGEERVHPLVYQDTGGDDVVIFASNYGGPNYPAWYYNLLAHPEATIEIGGGTRPVRARVTEGDERERFWTRQKQDRPNFADYEQKTTRTIPVIVLEPAG
jgi:deazaflavin-dependent oxidoreductase (nitroreductase family)